MKRGASLRVKDIKGMSLAESHAFCQRSLGGSGRPTAMGIMLVSLERLEEVLPGPGPHLPPPL